MKRITTRVNVNAREGAGTIYDIKNRIRRGTTLDYSETKMDGGGTVWYLTTEGWICGKFVTLSRDAQGKVDPKHKMNLQLFDLEDDTDWLGLDDRGLQRQQTSDEAPDPDAEPGESGGSSSNPDDFNPAPYDLDADTDGTFEDGNDRILARRIFGIPHQFLPSTDIRLNELFKQAVPDGELGYNYLDILAELPVLTVMPGQPLFLPDMNKDEKSSFYNLLDDLVSQIASTGRLAQDALSSFSAKTTPGRFFTFTPNFGAFARYFNTLCQLNAYMMGIGDQKIPGIGANFGEYNWSYYALCNRLLNRRPSDDKWFGDEEYGIATSVYSQITGAAARISDLISRGMADAQEFLTGQVSKKGGPQLTNLTAQYYTDFVVNPNVSYSETLSNVTGDSAMSQFFQGASAMSKELGFLLNSSVVASGFLDNSGQMVRRATAEAGYALGGQFGDFIAKLGSGATSIIQGANMVFPQIWKGSNFAQNYNIEINLSTPYGDKKSIFLDLLVPMWYWVALTAPRQADANSYMSPFLIRCHIPGLCSVDTGIVESLTIEKGGGNTEYSVEGFPLSIKLSIHIKDLYANLMISAINGVNGTDALNFLWNHQLIDYISIQSGCDMRKNQLGQMISAVRLLIANKPKEISDTFQHTLMELLSKMTGQVRY